MDRDTKENYLEHMKFFTSAFKRRPNTSESQVLAISFYTVELFFIMANHRNKNDEIYSLAGSALSCGDAQIMEKVTWEINKYTRAKEVDSE